MPSPTPDLLLRDGRAEDVPAIARIHAHRVRHAGLLPAIGRKHGSWVDSVLMTRPLGEGAATPPPEAR